MKNLNGNMETVFCTFNEPNNKTGGNKYGQNV